MVSQYQLPSQEELLWQPEEMSSFGRSPTPSEQILELFVPGRPYTQKRPRLSAQGTAYDPSSKEKAYIRTVLRLEKNIRIGNMDLLYGPVRFEAVFIFCPPASWSDKKQRLALGQYIFCQNKFDLDNLCKIYADCLTGIVWDDDHQMVSCVTYKVFGEREGVILRIDPLNPEEHAVLRRHLAVGAKFKPLFEC